MLACSFDYIVLSAFDFTFFYVNLADGGMPPRPACEQVFNIFNLADPFAYRLEPLLDASFEHIPVVHLPTSLAHSSDQWQCLREHLSLAAAMGDFSIHRKQQQLQSTPSSFSAPHLQVVSSDDQILGRFGQGVLHLCSFILLIVICWFYHPILESGFFVATLVEYLFFTLFIIFENIMS